MSNSSANTSSTDTMAASESCATIRRRGFSLLVMPEREPLAIDWDEPPHAEPPRPFRRRRQRAVA